ncbi:hypothetical protein [Natrinema salaciae]|uniref:PIN domain-containing protein n=1 Tax=Natrinema salaciae TaxID=1186196 RepID=A0A1H8ZRZ0_9EURY|nr:hypothetical protein [Natrinema salaciae]SEP67236.1 hypothetical protein SAMN04489841_0247 [Natrinema salaciae]
MNLVVDADVVIFALIADSKRRDRSVTRTFLSTPEFVHDESRTTKMRL